MGIANDPNRGLKTLIVFLVIAVVGLVAGVVVVNVQRNNQPEEIELTTEMGADIFIEIANGTYGMSTEEAIRYLDEQIEKYRDIPGLAYSIAMIKVSTYEDAGMLDDAINFLEELSNNNFDATQRAGIYCRLSWLYIKSGDDEKGQYYQNKCEEYANVEYEE